MADESIHQALFGYAKGHRLLASSRPLPTETGRVLRAVTDAAVEGNERVYLTVLPLREIRAQAFIRTWPAEGGLRPGSVWSHVILVDFPTLARFESFGWLDRWFVRPRPDSDGSLDLTDFRRSIPVTAVTQDASGSRLGMDSTRSGVDAALATDIVQAVYGSSGRITIPVSAASEAEPTLLAVYEQQWPRLRRQFAFRTRLRSSEGPIEFDLEVVERSRQWSPGGGGERSDWVLPLVEDLSVEGGSDVRQFLRAYGAESSAGRRDLPRLVEVHGSLLNGEPNAAVSLLCRSFPSPRQMRRLKLSLLGPPTEGGGFLPRGWPEDDAARLELLFAADFRALDYDDLDVGDRLASAVRGGGQSAALALRRLDLENLPPEHVRTLVSAVAIGASDDAAALVATKHPDLGALLVAQRPLLLSSPALWDSLDEDLVLGILERAPSDARNRVLRSLVESKAFGPLASVVSATPSVWWDLVVGVAAASEDLERVLADGQILRDVLARVGAASIGSPERPLLQDRECLALLACADLTAGVWRHVEGARWMELWQRATERAWRLPLPLCERLATVTLVSGTGSGTKASRIAAWIGTFARLHEDLGRADFDTESWRLLASVLPAAPEWDRCLRLRRGAVVEIRRDRWESEAVGMLLSRASGFEGQMLAELRSMPSKKKSKYWLRDIIETLLQ